MARVFLGRRSRGLYLGIVNSVKNPITTLVYALLALIEKSELRPLVGIYDGENARNTLPDIVDAGEFGGCSSSDLASP